MPTQKSLLKAMKKATSKTSKQKQRLQAIKKASGPKAKTPGKMRVPVMPRPERAISRGPRSGPDRPPTSKPMPGTRKKGTITFRKKRVGPKPTKRASRKTYI